MGQTTGNSSAPPDRTILDMPAADARKFLLKEKSYCDIDLPDYFTFQKLLDDVSDCLEKTPLDKILKDPKNHENVNHSITSNKDGRHAWRPYKLIHPAFYVGLVHQITSDDNWELITSRFRAFQQHPNIECIGIPRESKKPNTDKAAQIKSWWHGIEQRSLELALEYSYVFHADITDCYSSIYTHSIAWALHTKDKAREDSRQKDKNKQKLIGNIIDMRIQAMSHGQSNGIPQGSVLWDFIAEMVLGYADLELSARIGKGNINDFRILRYRDDYRIFVNNPQEGEQILKFLTETLFRLGLKLNSSKTTSAKPIVSSALKPDKKAWLCARQDDRNLQNRLLIIHSHGGNYPNAGSLIKLLLEFRERVSKSKGMQDLIVLASIAVDIAFTSPRVIPHCLAIVSLLLKRISKADERLNTINKIRRKLLQLPNNSQMEIWLQRISHPYDASIEYEEPLCKLVKEEISSIWNNEWFDNRELTEVVIRNSIVDQKKLESLSAEISSKEINNLKLVGDFYD